MLKTKKVIAIVLSLLMAIAVLSGCGSTKTNNPGNTGNTGNTGNSGTTNESKLKDGVYKVEFESFDTHGYKGQLELTVAGGKVSAVKFDEVMADGKLKSQDADYKTNMEKVTKTYPEKAYQELVAQALAKQASNVDGVAGATSSSTTFKKLLAYALDEMAAKGKTEPAKIK